MHWLLLYDGPDDFVERRVPFREEHLALARAAHERGELVVAGGLADPIDGSVFVFAGDGPEVAEDFARADPYVTNGVATSWRVRGWTIAVGSLP